MTLKSILQAFQQLLARENPKGLELRFSSLFYYYYLDHLNSEAMNQYLTDHAGYLKKGLSVLVYFMLRNLFFILLAREYTQKYAMSH